MTAAKADLVAAQASVRGNEGLRGVAVRFGACHRRRRRQDRHAQAQCHARIEEGVAHKAQADYDRNKPLVERGAVSQQEMDAYTEAMLVAKPKSRRLAGRLPNARFAGAAADCRRIGQRSHEVPADLNQTFSSVREAQAS